MTPFHLRQRLARVLLADSPDDAIAYCRGLVRKSRSNFSYAFLFLPPSQKEALEAVYAFCRMVDDAVDQSGDAAALAKWRDELDQAFGGQPRTPVGKQLAVAARAFPIRRADLERVLEGVEMDLRKLRFATWIELRDYCEHVASAVGLVCLEIFGVVLVCLEIFGHATERTRRYAIELGVAMQLTNILRDVAEDARHGHIYLPGEDLAKFNVAEEDVLARRNTPAFRDLVHFEADRARTLYTAARGGLDEHDRHKLFVAEIMADIYQALLEAVVAAERDIMAVQPRLRRRRKLALAMRRWLEARITTDAA
jgi:phytoene synthase